MQIDQPGQDHPTGLDHPQRPGAVVVTSTTCEPATTTYPSGTTFSGVSTPAQREPRTWITPRRAGQLLPPPHQRLDRLLRHHPGHVGPVHDHRQRFRLQAPCLLSIANASIQSSEVPLKPQAKPRRRAGPGDTNG